MKKLFIVSLICIFLGFTFAIEQYKGDCGLASIDIGQILNKIDFSKNLVIKKDEALLAHENLKKYCCSKGVLNDCEGGDEVPQSFYFFEHLVDIGLRKLDGDEKRKVYGSLELDPDGKNYRKKLQEIAYDKDKKDPKEILNLYNEYFSFKSTDKLYYKYSVVCREVENVDKYLFRAYSNQRNVSLDGGFLNRCQKLVTNRINLESKYITHLNIKKSNEFMLDNLKEYTNEYFIKDRFEAMFEKFTQILGIFRMIVRRATPGVGICDGG